MSHRCFQIESPNGIDARIHGNPRMLPVTRTALSRLIDAAAGALRASEFFPGNKGAIFSPCGTFRYALWRIWSPSIKPLMVIGLNPSRAGAVNNDNTTIRCIGYAVDWGFGGLLLGNPFAFCDTRQTNLLSAPDRIGPDNDLWLMRMRDYAGLHLAAWGNNAEIDPDRVAAVRAMFPTLYTLGFTQKGYPKHPLRLSRELQPLIWEAAA